MSRWVLDDPIDALAALDREALRRLRKHERQLDSLSLLTARPDLSRHRQALLGSLQPNEALFAGPDDDGDDDEGSDDEQDDDGETG